MFTASTHYGNVIIKQSIWFSFLLVILNYTDASWEIEFAAQSSAPKTQTSSMWTNEYLSKIENSVTEYHPTADLYR